MAQQKSTSKSAKILYRPIGLASSMVSGVLAGIVFKQVWKRVSPGHQEDAPKALSSEFKLREVLLAAVLQGAIYSLVKTLVDRGGAKLFEDVTGDWPGD